MFATVAGPKPDVLIRLFLDSRQASRCTGCGADITFYETLNGRRMPMNAAAVAQKREAYPDTTRVIGYFSSRDSHFANCPDTAQFRRRR